mmetsp:Transcript_35607/g.53569  ORF Transcript_35607/g.53569 Transcript_35607/m.53569 type:complete len:95 (+) Transcript_35607:573-857(+)
MRPCILGLARPAKQLAKNKTKARERMWWAQSDRRCHRDRANEREHCFVAFINETTNQHKETRNNNTLLSLPLMATLAAKNQESRNRPPAAAARS